MASKWTPGVLSRGLAGQRGAIPKPERDFVSVELMLQVLRGGVCSYVHVPLTRSYIVHACHSNALMHGL